MPGPTIVEDRRTLAAFYPDPDRRAEVEYAFGHVFLPAYVQRMNPGFLEQAVEAAGRPDPDTLQRLIQSRFMLFEELSGLVDKPEGPISEATIGFRRIADLGADVVALGDGRALMVRFPVPVRPVGAFRALVVRRPDRAAASPLPAVRYFTLESTDMGDAPSAPGPARGTVCEWIGQQHVNFGVLAPDTDEAFIGAVASVLTPAA